MAVVSAAWPATASAAGHPRPGPSYSTGDSDREMRKFDNPAMNDGDNSDAYSFEARSEISDNNDTQGPPGASGEAVRPDSLALTSPLEQLTRSLSFNKKDGQHAPPLQQSARGGVRERIAQDSIAGLPSAEQVMLEYLAAETNYDSNASTSGQPRQDASIGQQQQHLPNAVNSNSQHAASHETAFDTTFEPVRFSNDTTRTGGTEDVSDSQGQLINAFRSSYHTYMTRSGGMRDSSYSWMGPDADSPNMTMDFKQAEASFDAARRNGEAIDLGRYDDFEGEDDSGDLSAGQPGEDLDADGKAKARSSSWDSQEVKKMGLNRIPSQKSQKTHKTPTDGRTSDVSAFEPFQYSNYESALRASKHATQQEQIRASNWTDLSDLSLPDDYATSGRPLSTIDEGGQSPSLYAYAVDSPSVMQGSFVGPARITSSAIPIPARSKSQAGRTNFSRPHDMLTSKDANDAQEQAEEHLSPAIGSQLPYAEASPQQEQGHSHPARQTHDSVYSAYTETSEFGTPRAAPQAPFQPAVRPEYSPFSSSRTVQTIHENNGSQRSELQSFDSYQRSYHEPPATRAPPTSSSNAKRHRRTPSQVLASAIAKHRAQRAAAGLTTEGQYYVDPKTKKYYFVADSGQAGGSALSKSKEGKESDKSKERRKLHKKEAGWEITKVKSPQSATPPHTPQQEYQRDRSFSISSRSKGSSRGSEEGHGSASKWKIWSSNRGHGSRDNTPQASPLQPSPMNRDPNTSQGHLYSDQNGQETLAISNSPGNGPHVAQQPGSHFPGAPTYPQASPRIVQVPPDNYFGRSPSSSPENRLNSRGMASSSSQGHGSYLTTPRLQPPPNFGYPVDEHGHPGHAMQRSNSVYSNYSYYEMPSDQGYISSSRASPVMERSQSSSRGHSSNTNTPVPMSSPYMAPNGPEFQPTSGSHSRQPSTTLDKAKSSMHRSGSLQLLAPSKHQNLTVPKGDAAHGLDLAELARTNPNDPLVCLHLGIDAHERGDLEESAQLFEKSANGGCGLGMLMFGLSLRHGWGCESQPERGFKYLQQAAESVVQNLDRVISGHVQLSEQQLEEQSAKSELVLSIYELGQCFLRGWGVAKDKKTALQYFTLAANLGDPDAQSELGFCYSTGRGCKKDLKMAAKYYRMAAKQGQITYGMQWIFKSKYDD